MSRLIIIGAGASGLMAAISAAAKASRIGADVDITVLEHMNRAGIKLSQTGNGRCNLTNEFIDETCYQNNNTSFVMNIINRFTPHDVIEFFNSIGVLTKTRCGYAGTENLLFKYVYPNSDQASTIAESLACRAVKLGVKFEYETEVTNIEKKKSRFIINAVRHGENIVYIADALIIAAGSCAAPKTGSDGSGYRLAKSLGHRIVKPLPALVQLESPDKVCRTIAGVRSDACIEIYTGNCIITAHGELQFTDYGISGIPVFQVSRHAVRALEMHKKVYAVIDLLPLIDNQKLCRILCKNAQEDTLDTLFSVLGRMMNKKLAAGVMQVMGISQKTLLSEFDNKDIEKISQCIKNFRLDISGYKSFDKAQICSGGVRPDELDYDTLESKLIPGLYFCGEILDVDGICGGYNLQWAWSSGYTAGSEAAAGASQMQ